MPSCPATGSVYWAPPRWAPSEAWPRGWRSGARRPPRRFPRRSSATTNWRSPADRSVSTRPDRAAVHWPAVGPVRASGRDRLSALQAQATALPLRQSAPDAEPLVVGQGELQALGPDLAAGADTLGLAGGAALLREERLRVRLGAQRVLPPRLVAARENAPRRRLCDGGGRVGDQ